MGCVRSRVRHVPGARRWQRPDCVAVQLHVAHRRAKIAEYVVALLGEGDLVDRVPDETSFQHQRSILAGVTPVKGELNV